MLQPCQTRTTLPGVIHCVGTQVSNVCEHYLRWAISYACMHTSMHTYIHTCMHACMHANIHTYVHTYVHTDCYTPICICSLYSIVEPTWRRRDACDHNLWLMQVEAAAREIIQAVPEQCYDFGKPLGSIPCINPRIQSSNSSWL